MKQESERVSAHAAAPFARPVVLFDLDGTLLDSAPGIAAALNSTRLGKRHVSADLARSLVSFGAERLIKESLDISDADIAAALAEFRKVYAADPCTSDDLYPDVLSVLERLRALEVGLGVCTNKPQQLAELVLQRIGVASLMEVVVGGAPDLPAKPDAAPVLRALKGMEPVSKALFVGDSHIDAEAAQSAGLPFVFASFGYGGTGTKILCAARIGHFSELLGVVHHIFEPAV